MENLRQKTIDTYNQSARQLAEYFRGIGPRDKYINYAFEMAGNPEAARVVEIGCGDGRDAKVIAQRADWYLGVDISEELIELAKEHVPGARFQVADAATFDYPDNLDVVFAFASILHLDKKELKAVLQKIHGALRPNGVFYISSKYAPEYTEQIKKDQYGERLFYFYNAELLEQMAEGMFETINTWNEAHGNTEWFEIALRKT